MTSRRAADGLYWESVAARHLERHGLTVLERGYRCRLGEIDIVCRDAATLVIVEVRARGCTAYTTALESVDALKRRRIVNAARHFLMRHPALGSMPLRFDVIAIDAADTGSPALNWVRNAFEGG